MVAAVVLLAGDALAFGQGERGDSKPRGEAPSVRAEALWHKALQLAASEEHEAAHQQLQEAMRLWEQSREPDKAAQAALQLGDRYKRARKYYDALNDYQQALGVKSLPGAFKANALNAIALTYAELYLHDLAAHYFKRALDQARLAANLPAQMVALTGLADLYQRQGASDNAMPLITQAVRLGEQSQADADPALLIVKGRVIQEQGALEEAKGAFEEAQEIYVKTANVAGQVKALCALSALALRAGQQPAALAQAEKAVSLAEQQAKRAVGMADDINALELRWPAWLSQARAERALGRKAEALNSYSRAIRHLIPMWWTVYIATEASAVAFREEVQAAYRENVDLLMELGQFKKAYDLADEAKARTLLNFTGARQATPRAEDGEEEAALREMAHTIARLRLQWLAPDLSREQQAELQKELDEAELKQKEVQSRAEMKQTKKRLVWTPLASADELQKQTARNQTVLAEFFLGEDRSFAWLFAHGELFFEILPARPEIERGVRSFLALLAAPPNYLVMERDLARLRAQAEALFTTLFGRLSEHLEPGKRLIVVPDGLLHYLPFESLIRNGRYLVEDHEISYNPSASMLGLWPEAGGRVAVADDKLELFAVGDPVFGSGAKVAGARPLKTGARGPARRGVAERAFRLTPLPRTRDEVQDIAALFPADRRRVCLGSASTEAAIKREPLGRYRRLHFATHSLIDEKTPSRSAVVLTPDLEAGEDGLLEAGEISRLRLDADLVVVSACQTGRGKLLSGEGIVGLSRSFLHAGARSVVVSLWNVSDIATGQLMKAFYQQMTGGQTNAGALRRAKLQMLGSGKETRHPYYWASFIMVGKP